MLRHLLVHLQTHHAAELTLPHALLDGFQKIFGLQFLDGDIGVARHVERVHLDDLHAGEQGIEVGRDHLLDPDVGLLPARAGALVRRRVDPRQGHQRGQRVGHFDARESFIAAGIADQDGQVKAQIRDMRKWPSRVERQRREYGKNDLREVVFARLQLLGIEFMVRHHVDALLGETGPQFLFQALVGGVYEALHLAPDGHQLRARAHPVRAEFGDAGVQLRIQAGHPDHEELIQIGAHDGQELHAFQQRIGGVARLFQHAPLKAQQAELAVDVETWIVEIRRLGPLRMRRGVLAG